MIIFLLFVILHLVYATQNDESQTINIDAQDQALQDFCKGRGNDVYLHLYSCSKFIACSDGDSYVKLCPKGLQFNDVEKQCVKPEESHCFIYVGEATFGDKGNNFGKVSVNRLPRGDITQIKLEAVSGHRLTAIETVITDRRDKVLFHQNTIHGHTTNNEFIVFNEYINKARDIETVRSDTLPGNELRIWQKKDLENYKTSTTTGSGSEIVIKVYITVNANEDTIPSTKLDPTFEGICKNRRDGRYQHPYDCRRYVECSDQVPKKGDCPGYTRYWNDVYKQCVYRANTCLELFGRTTFGAKDQKYGTISLKESQGWNEARILPKGRITQIKLDYISGYVTCKEGVENSKWGCNNDENTIAIVITNKDNKILYQQNKIPGYTGNSDYIVFNEFGNEATSNPVTIAGSFPDDEMRIWYKEALENDETVVSDNDGSVTVDVYITVDFHGREPTLEFFCDGFDFGSRKGRTLTHPSNCNKYIVCGDKYPNVMTCPSGLHYNQVRNECVEPELSNCLIDLGETTVGATGDNFGLINMSKVPRGTIPHVKFEYVSGFLLCDENVKPSKWGCFLHNGIEDLLPLVRPFNNENDLKFLAHLEGVERGYNITNNVIIYNDWMNSAFQKPVTTEKFPGNEMRIWFQYDLYDWPTNGNITSFETLKVYVTVHTHEDPTLEGFCGDCKDGFYQHPSRCDRFILCSNGNRPRVIKCPVGLHFNNAKKQCDLPRKTTCLRYVGETTFGAKDNSFGVVYLNNFPRGNITQIKLEHDSGYVSCTSGVEGSKWGCNNVGGNYNETVIGIVIANKNGEMLFYQRHISGYTGNSEYIVFNDYANEAVAEKPITTESFIDDEIHIWYKEDLDGGSSTSDNSGSEKIRVYVTIDADDENQKSKKKSPDADSRNNEAKNDVILINACNGRKDGHYNYPTRCDSYVTCIDHGNAVIAAVTRCPSGLHYNYDRDDCINPNEANCFNYVGDTWFGAKDDNFGTVSLSNLPRGKIAQIKLEYVSGYVTCHGGLEGSKWGCNNNNHGVNISDVISTVITDRQNKIIYKQSKIPGFTGNSEFIVFNDNANEASDVSQPITTESFPGDELRVWYNADLENESEYDNWGSERIRVYVTIHTDKPDQYLEGFCEDRKDGNYQYPSSCRKYVTCDEHIPNVIKCPSGLHYNHNKNKCVDPADSYCLIYLGETTFGAKDRNFGAITVENVPKGYIKFIKLEHVSGTVTCNNEEKYGSYWGCPNKPLNIMTVITNAENEVLFKPDEQSKLPGYSGRSESIVFSRHKDPVSTESLSGKELRVWYKDDLENSTTNVYDGTETIKVYVTIDAFKDDILTDVCNGRKNGNYNHPTRCDSFVTCIDDSNAGVFECPSGLHYNYDRDDCINPHEANCFNYVGDTWFGAKDDSFGTVSLSNLPRGKIAQIKLEYVSGYVTCHGGLEGSKWGCNNNNHGVNISDVISTVITDRENKIIYKQNRIPGLTGNSEFIVFNDNVNEASDVDQPITTESFPGNELRVWYNADLENESEYDNWGSEKISVYVTVHTDKLDPYIEGFCQHRRDGDYQYPSSCQKYVVCYKDIPYPMECPSRLHYNHARKECVNPAVSNCLILLGETTFGAKDKNFGAITVENVPKGYIKFIKLEHVSGTVTCNNEEKYGSYWGCPNNPLIITTVITNAENEVLFKPDEQNKLPGYSGRSESIVFSRHKDPVSTESLSGKELRVWYKDDLENSTTNVYDGEETIKVYVTIDAFKDPTLEGVCKHHRDDLRPHPSRCDVFISCSVYRPDVMTCPHGLYFNNAIKQCVHHTKSNCLTYVGQTVLKAKDGGKGVVSLQKLPRGKITQVKLEYISGYVSCTSGVEGSKWGCNSRPEIEKNIYTVITNNDNMILFEQELMPGYTGNSEFIVFNDYANDGLKTITTENFPGDEMRIWYKEDLVDSDSVHDNSGEEVIKVYVTVEAEEGVEPGDIEKTISSTGGETSRKEATHDEL